MVVFFKKGDNTLLKGYGVMKMSLTVSETRIVPRSFSYTVMMIVLITSKVSDNSSRGCWYLFFTPPRCCTLLYLALYPQTS